MVRDRGACRAGAGHSPDRGDEVIAVVVVGHNRSGNSANAEIQTLDLMSLKAAGIVYRRTHNPKHSTHGEGTRHGIFCGINRETGMRRWRYWEVLQSRDEHAGSTKQRAGYVTHNGEGNELDTG